MLRIHHQRSTLQRRKPTRRRTLRRTHRPTKRTHTRPRPHPPTRPPPRSTPITPTIRPTRRSHHHPHRPLPKRHPNRKPIRPRTRNQSRTTRHPTRTNHTRPRTTRQSRTTTRHLTHRTNPSPRKKPASTTKHTPATQPRTIPTTTMKTPTKAGRKRAPLWAAHQPPAPAPTGRGSVPELERFPTCAQHPFHPDSPCTHVDNHTNIKGSQPGSQASTTEVDATPRATPETTQTKIFPFWRSNDDRPREHCNPPPASRRPTGPHKLSSRNFAPVPGAHEGCTNPAHTGHTSPRPEGQKNGRTTRPPLPPLGGHHDHHTTEHWKDH